MQYFEGRSTMTGTPLIVGIGGTTRPNSSCEKLLRAALDMAERRGARTILLGAADLAMPHYAPERPERSAESKRLAETVAQADAVLISSPGYHGSISGLLKNALDYIEDLRGDRRPYLDGRAVGLIVSAGGWQATATTLAALRSIVHALRGWPTPLGVCVNTSEPFFGDDGPIIDGIQRQLDLLVDQMMQFTQAFASLPTDTRALA